MSCIGNAVKDGMVLKRVRPPRKRHAPSSRAGSTVTLNSPHRSPNDSAGVVMVAPDAWNQPMCHVIKPQCLAVSELAVALAIVRELEARRAPTACS